MTRRIMDYMLISEHSMEITCRTCHNKRDVTGRDYPVCSIGIQSKCRAANYEYWVFPIGLCEKGETVRLLGVREVEEE